jgi:hypothetical protein
MKYGTLQILHQTANCGHVKLLDNTGKYFIIIIIIIITMKESNL